MENSFAPELVFIIYSLVCSLRNRKVAIKFKVSLDVREPQTQLRNTQYFSIPNSSINISKNKHRRHMRIQKYISTLQMSTNKRTGLEPLLRWPLVLQLQKVASKKHCRIFSPSRHCCLLTQISHSCVYNGKLLPLRHLLASKNSNMDTNSKYSRGKKLSLK